MSVAQSQLEISKSLEKNIDSLDYFFSIEFRTDVEEVCFSIVTRRYTRSTYVNRLLCTSYDISTYSTTTCMYEHYGRPRSHVVVNHDGFGPSNRWAGKRSRSGMILSEQQQFRSQQRQGSVSLIFPAVVCSSVDYTIHL
jgi:hypothetical protein